MALLLLFVPLFFIAMGSDKSMKIEFYVSNVQGCSNAGKMAALQARTSSADYVILNETNKFRGDESVFSQLKCSATALTNTPDAETRVGPGHGTFLGTKQWYPQ